ncbi:MAG: phytanoyl-CoA dioxygenase family protein [bacterium]|nr:phytanoyl-CoA dioxygenase family protein [bacterium]
MDKIEMSNEDNYAFDIAGFLHIPGVLTKPEISRVNAAICAAGKLSGMLGWEPGQRDPFRELLVHPQLVWVLNQIIGPGFRLDREPEIWCRETCDGHAPLSGGNEPREPGAAYYHQNHRRYCEGVRVIWALEDIPAQSGGFVLVPGTHKSNVATPESVANGTDDSDYVCQPALKAGDLLIVGLSVLQGIRPWLGQGSPRLLTYEFVGRAVIRSPGIGAKSACEPRSDWMEALTPEQRASLYKPGYRDTVPPPSLCTDGSRVTLDASRRIHHPSILARDPRSLIDEREFYFWDLNGYLVLRGVMDEAWLAEANAVVDRFNDQIEVGEVTSGKSKSLVGSGRPELKGLLQLPGPHCDPFRRMIAHPVVEHRLNWMGASGGRTGNPSVFASVKGTSGHAQHGNGEPVNPGRQYVYQNGRSYCEAVTVTWQLRDVTEADGGFACVPGSHKAKYPPPPGVQTCDDAMGLVKHIGMKAGDVLFFMDGATSHGTFKWLGDQARRGVLVKYSSRNFNRSGGDLAHPEARWGDLVVGMSDAQLAVMRGADRDVFDRNVPRLEVRKGEVSVSYERGGALYSKDTPTGPVAKS